MQDQLNMSPLMWLPCWRVDGSTPTHGKEGGWAWASVANLSGSDALSLFKQSSGQPLRQIRPSSFLNFSLWLLLFIQRAPQWKESSFRALWYWFLTAPSLPHVSENSAEVWLWVMNSSVDEEVSKQLLHHPQRPWRWGEATRGCSFQGTDTFWPSVGLQLPFVALSLQNLSHVHTRAVYINISFSTNPPFFLSRSI